MYITDWDKWCKDNHIKLKGSGVNDSGKNEGSNNRSVCGSKMAMPSSGNGQSTSNSSVQANGRRRII